MRLLPCHVHSWFPSLLYHTAFLPVCLDILCEYCCLPGLHASCWPLVSRVGGNIFVPPLVMVCLFLPGSSLCLGSCSLWALFLLLLGLVPSGSPLFFPLRGCVGYITIPAPFCLWPTVWWPYWLKGYSFLLWFGLILPCWDRNTHLASVGVSPRGKGFTSLRGLGFRSWELERSSGWSGLPWPLFKSPSAWWSLVLSDVDGLQYWMIGLRYKVDLVR